MEPSQTSPYAPRPARGQVHRTTPFDPGLLPVSLQCLPHLRRPCILRARSDYAEWDRDTREFIPVLDVQPLRAGAQGVDQLRDGGLVVAHLQADLQARRWRVLVNGDPMLSDIVEGGRFLVDYDCERGLVATVPFWERPKIVSRDRELKWEADQAARRRFITMCVEARVIDPITVEACQAVLQRESATLQELSTELRSRKGQASPELTADVRRREIRVAHMEARLAGEDPFELEEEPAIAQAKGRARRLDAVSDLPTAAAAPAPAAELPPLPAGIVTLAAARAMAQEAAREAVAVARDAFAAILTAERAAATPARRHRAKTTGAADAK